MSKLIGLMKKMFPSAETRRKAEIKEKLLKQKRVVFADNKTGTPWYSLQNSETQLLIAFVLALLPFTGMFEGAFYDVYYSIKLWSERVAFIKELDEKERLANAMDDAAKRDV